MSPAARSLPLLVMMALAAAGAGRAQSSRAPDSAATSAEQTALGAVIARRDCGGCHAIGRTGESPLAGAPRFRELYRRYPAEQLGEALAEGIVVGHGPMPERSFAPAEVEALVAYLKSLEPASSRPLPTSKP